MDVVQVVQDVLAQLLLTIPRHNLAPTHAVRGVLTRPLARTLSLYRTVPTSTSAQDVEPNGYDISAAMEARRSVYVRRQLVSCNRR
jgi:hypothetical protein